MVLCSPLSTIDEILRSVQLQLPPLRTHVSRLVTHLLGTAIFYSVKFYSFIISCILKSVKLQIFVVAGNFSVPVTVHQWDA